MEAHGDQSTNAGHDSRQGLTRAAVTATAHCLTGCAIGEILGLVLGTWWGWDTGATIALAVALTFGLAFVVTVPVNRWLIGRGRGHAVAAAYHS